MLKKIKFLMVLAAVFAVAGCKAEVENETPKCTITYDENGHGTAPEAKTVEEGYKLTEADLPALTADGFDFGGWKFNEKIVAAGEEVVSDMTLIAAWTEWGTAATPTFSVAAGEVDKGTKVKITCTTEGAVIYYTTDGSAPTADSTKYESEIEITAATTIKAFAIKSGMKNSTVAEVTYTVDVTPPANVTNLTAKCTASQTVKLTWTIPADTDFAKVVITYGTDGKVEVLKTATPNNETEVTGLTNGTEYTFTVKAYDNAENASSGTNVKAKPYTPSPALSTKAGKKPENVQGTQTIPTFGTNITDHLYLAESSLGVTGRIDCSDTNNASTYQWYTGTTGNWQKVTSNGTSRELKITVTTGTTYYMLEAKSADGNSIAYSNVCTVICGGEKTANVGKIAYDDDSYNSGYVSGRTPVGIIFDVKEDGSPKTIVNLSQGSSKSWCFEEADGYSKNFATEVTTPLSYTDGSSNWNIICDNVTDEGTTGNYPAFEYCNGLTDGGKTWYLPARDELSTLYFNRTAVNNAIKILKDNDVTATELSTSSVYWSSSQYAFIKDGAWIVYFNDGGQNGSQKHGGTNNVRGVASF